MAEDRSEDCGWSRRSLLVETQLLGEALADLETLSTLDIGCGDGRLYGTILRRARSYVGIDLDSEALRRLEHVGSQTGTGNAVRGTATNLPFASSSFSLAVMFRLYHRFRDPERALSEAARVLVSGGRLALLVVPRPTPFTLSWDMWTAVKHRNRVDSFTFSRIPRTEVHSSRQFGAVETIATTRSRLLSQGFVITDAMGCGFETLPLLRRLPVRFWVKLARIVPKRFLSPGVLVIAQKRVSSP